MTRKRLLLLTGAAAVVIIAAVTVYVVFVVLPAPSSITKANFDRIKDGMSYTDVAEIFGEEWNLDPNVTRFAAWVDPHMILLGWRAVDGSEAIVTFVSGGVTKKNWNPSTESLWDMLRRWLQLK